MPAKRDYGWLSETILRRMEELKRYPASARVDRAEGKVVVKAVIDEDGSISEVGVFLSWGTSCSTKPRLKPCGKPPHSICRIHWDAAHDDQDSHELSFGPLTIGLLVHGLRIRSRNPEDTWTKPS